MRFVAALVMTGMALLLAGCSTAPLWQAASLRGKPIGEVIARYGQPTSGPLTMADYTWSKTEDTAGSCSMHVSTDAIGVVTGVIMNGDATTCQKLRQRKAAETGSTGQDVAMSLPSAFHLDASEHVFVKVSVNGHPSVWMLVDTGTTPSAINSEYARSIGLKYDGVQQRGAGAGSDPINIKRTVVSSLQCGLLIKHQIPFVTVDYSRSGPDGKPIAGVLGYSFLRDHTLILDYRKGIVSVSKRRLSYRSSIPFVLTNDISTVRVSLNQHTMNALLDTGGGYQLLVTPETAERIGLRSSQANVRQTSGVGYGGTQMFKVGSGPAFSIGSVIKSESEITYMPLPIRVDGAIGTHFFKDYRVELDYQSKLVRFSAD